MNLTIDEYSSKPLIPIKPINELIL